MTVRVGCVRYETNSTRSQALSGVAQLAEQRTVRNIGAAEVRHRRRALIRLSQVRALPPERRRALAHARARRQFVRELPHGAASRQQMLPKRSDQTHFGRLVNGSGAVCDPKLAERTNQMGFDRRSRNEALAGHLLVRQALGDQGEDFAFAHRQRR
jgi:hypothetical protein